MAYGGDKSQLKFISVLYNRLLHDKFNIQEKVKGYINSGKMCADLIIQFSEIQEMMLYIDEQRTYLVNPKGVFQIG